MSKLAKWLDSNKDKLPNPSDESFKTGFKIFMFFAIAGNLCIIAYAFSSGQPFF